jgi:type II secretory pathway predicted ATPase ExeA
MVPTTGNGDGMLTDVMTHYGLARDLRQAGYFETEHHTQIVQEMRAAILTGSGSQCD